MLLPRAFAWFPLLAACSSGPGNAVPDGPPAGSPDAAADAISSIVWTPQSQSTLAVFGATVTGIWADPATPRHLLVGLGNSSTHLLVEWTDGAFGSALVPPTGQGASLAQAGVGFAGSCLFAYYGNVPSAPNQTPFKLATASAGGSWTWVDLGSPLYYSLWPPRRLSVGAGGSAREVLFSEAAIWDATGKLDPIGVQMWPEWRASSLTPDAEGGFESIRFVPGTPDTFLATMYSTPTVHRCTFGSTLTCAATEATGFADSDTLGDIAMSAADPSRVYVAAHDAQFSSLLYASSDGGATFSAVALPPARVSFSAWAVSPVSPDTLVLYFPFTQTDAGTTVPDQLVITHDRGATWTHLTLPQGLPTTDLDGMAFDAAGALYVAYSSTLFTAVP